MGSGGASDPPPGTTVTAPVLAFEGGDARRRDDLLAVEEPLEIRVVAEEGGRRRRHPVAVTMRTPGDDLELATGFLFGEGIVRRPEEIVETVHCDDVPAGSQGNVVEVVLAPGVGFDPGRFGRNLYTTSSCGVCGKASLEILRSLELPPLAGSFAIDRDVLAGLPERLRRAQTVFARTGGLHAAGLFTAAGELVAAREDVGRHNAVDKLVGERLAAAALPASGTLLLVSGRASFELVQKAAMAGVPFLAAVGAPSSLAVDTARGLGMTLIGFLQPERCNLYSGPERVREAAL